MQRLLQTQKGHSTFRGHWQDPIQSGSRHTQNQRRKADIVFTELLVLYPGGSRLNDADDLLGDGIPDLVRQLLPRQ